MNSCDAAAQSHSPFGKWARTIEPSALQRALARTADPTILSLALGLPDPELFPFGDLSAAYSRVLASNRHAGQYSNPCPKLKEAICRYMASRGVDCSPAEVFLTTGAQQGLSLLARLLLDHGDKLIEEEFTYTGFQQSVEPYAPQVIVVPTSRETGIQLDSLERALCDAPRAALLYVMADGHNPLGATMPLANRQRLAHLARELRIPVIEDDPYGSLSYEGHRIPPIRAFEREWVYYVGSFSKIIAPSLRVGWLIVPQTLTQKLSIIKEASDINMSTLSQWAVAEFLNMGALPQHLDLLIHEYRLRRDAMAAVLSAAFPKYCRWSRPQSGVFFWIELPSEINSSEILEAALEEERVAFLPAEAFSRGQKSNGIRLNFSRHNPEVLGEAISRIAKVISRSGSLRLDGL